MANVNLTPTPVLDTWSDGELMTADWLNRNVRDAQNFIANAPLTLVTRAATQSIPNSTVNSHVTWDTEVIDTDDMISVPSTDIVAQRPGLYSVQLQIPFATNTTGVQRSAAINLNGANVGQQADNPPTASPAMLVASAVVYMNTGDVLTGNAFQDSGAALNIGTFNGPRMLVRLVAAGSLTTSLFTASGSSAGAQPSAPPTGTNPTVHNATFFSTWSRTFGGNNATTWDDSAYCYQGYYSSDRGNTRSLVGFNYQAIQSTLAGATNVKAWITFHVGHTYYNAGSTIIIGTHNYSSKPSTWSTSNVDEDQTRRSSTPVGTFTVRLSDFAAWAFQNNVQKGIAFGPGPNTGLGYYAFINGATQSGRPYLTFQYTK